MGYAFFAISAYIFMRAFELIFKEYSSSRWYKVTTQIIGIAVIYTVLAAMVLSYFENVHLLGFDPE